jgi:hypothetical protein
MSFQIKISGIDENANKHMWIDIDNDGLDLNEECEYIRRNPNKKEKIEESNKLIEEIENRVKNLSIYKPPQKKRKIEEKMEKVEETIDIEEEIMEVMEETMEEEKEMEEMEEIENKIEVLSLEEKPKYTLNKDQEKILEYIEKYIGSNEIITVSGIAGAGKTFTILHIFDKLHELTKNKNICFCAPTNNVVERCKKYKTELEKHFKNVDFCTTSTLLGEKCHYTNDGKKFFKIVDKESNKIFTNDIIVIDEISMMNESQLDFIKSNKKRIGLCILLGDRNQLNPVNSDELDILNKSEINLTENMRCDNNEIHTIHNFMIKSIEEYDDSLDLNKFVYDLYQLLYTQRNNKSIYIVDNKEDLIDLYLSVYKTEKTIIGNYRNEECEKLNKQIKDKIIDKEKIKCIDNYFINQQIVFKEPYEDWNTSEFATIKNIESDNYRFKKIDIVDIINIIQEKNVETAYKKIENNIKKQYFNQFGKDDKKLYYNQELINYVIGQTKTAKLLKEIFKYINIFCDVQINTFTLHSGNSIRLIKDSYKKNYETSVDAVKHRINELNKSIYKQSKGTKSLYEKCIIQPLWGVLNKHRIDVFAQIESAFSCTIHRLQGATVDNICVNLHDLFRMTEKKNKLKCLYTCFSRCSNKLIIYMPTLPLCKCGSFCKERLHENIYMWSCNNKMRHCGYMEDKVEENEDCKKCKKCEKIYHKNMMYSDKKCLICKNNLK